MHHWVTETSLSLLFLCLQLCQLWMPDLCFCQYIRGSKFSLSPLDWKGKRNSLCANDFTSFLNSCKDIFFCALLQHKHSYFIVLTALSLIVPIKERCQCYFLFIFFCLCPKATHQCFLGWCVRRVTSIKWAVVDKGLDIMTEPPSYAYND